MSRTTRRPKFYIETSETKHIQRDIALAIRYPNTYIRVPKTEQELDEEYQRAVHRYEEAKKQARRSYWWYLDNAFGDEHWCMRQYHSSIPTVPVRHTHGTKRVAIEKSMDEVIAESKRDFSTYTRDGKWNETGRNTGFKQAAAKCVRRANKRFCSAVIRGEDVDNKIYPHEHLGDYLVWSFW